MQNYLALGNTATVPAAARAISAGDGLLVGNMFGVAVNDAALNGEAVLQLAGVFTLPKVAAGAIAQGARVYWNDTNHNVAPTASGNTLIGVAHEAAADGATTCTVRLNGSF